MDRNFIQSFIAGELKNGEIKPFNTQGTWSSFQKAYTVNLIFWNFSEAILIDDSAFGFKVQTEIYNPGWVVITSNPADLFRVYFVIEDTLIECKDDIYITDLRQVIHDVILPEN